MRKGKAIKGVIGVLAGMIGVVCIIGLIFIRTMPDELDMMRGNWGLHVPKEASLTKLYEKDSGSSFNGDGVRYYVYRYENEKAIEDMVSWSDEEQATWLYKSYHEAAESWLGEIEVENEYYPEFEKCVYWYKAEEQDGRNEIIVFWNQEKEQIYIVMSLF